MSYSVYAVPKFDEDGNEVPSSEFYVVDGNGKCVSITYDNPESAAVERDRLEEKDRQVVERAKIKPKSTSRDFGR